MNTNMLSFLAGMILLLLCGRDRAHAQIEQPSAEPQAEQIIITSPPNGAVFTINPDNSSITATIWCQVTGLLTGPNDVYGYAYRLNDVWSPNPAPPSNANYPVTGNFNFNITVGGGSYSLRVGLYKFNTSNNLWDLKSYSDVTFSCVQQHRIIVQNSFGGGEVKVDGLSYSSGAQFVWNASTSHTLEAIADQATTQDGFPYIWNYNLWTRDGGSPTSTNPLPITVTGNSVYEAQFSGQITITGTHTIQNGQTGIIQAGTSVRFEPGAKLLVNGKLLANGNSAERTTFTRSGTGDWLGIEFNGAGANNSSLQYCDFTYAKTPILATSVGNLTISNVTIGSSGFQNYPHDAAMAFYGSSPTISYTTVSGQSNSLNGVRFAQGSTGSISNSTIANCGAGNGIVVQGGSNPLISGNLITGSYYHGIVLPFSGGFPTIYDNTVTNNINQIYHGLMIDNSQAEIKGNVIDGHYAGMWINNQSFVRTPFSSDGSNHIFGNTYGIIIQDESDLEFGYVDEWNPSFYYGSCNKIENNSAYNVSMNGFAYMWAHGNYWLPTPPSGIIMEPTNGIEYNCYLQYPWDCNSFVACGSGPSSPASASAQTSDAEPMLRDAHNARMHRDYATSNSLFTGVMKESATSEQKRRALRGLYKNYLDTENATLVDEIKTLSESPSDISVSATQLLMKIYASTGKYADAIDLAQTLKTSYANSETEKHSLLFLSSLSGYSESQRNVSESALNELLAEYGSSIDKGMLAALGQRRVEESESGVAEAPAELSFESGAYPNPFNPSTVINFVLPEDGLVSLRVFDILGRVVAELINEARTAGPHSVTFDASHLASGAYYYRLESLGKALTGRLMFVK